VSKRVRVNGRVWHVVVCLEKVLHRVCTEPASIVMVVLMGETAMRIYSFAPNRDLFFPLGVEVGFSSSEIARGCGCACRR
jgi:hypothetical protein